MSEAPEVPAVKLLFESQTCTRCGGGGHYSYNQIDGTVCYGCGGRGVQLTRRGRAAQEYYHRLLEKPITELVIGDRVLDPGLAGFARAAWYTLDQVGPDLLNAGLIQISGLDARGERHTFGGFETTSLRIAHSTAEKRLLIQQALDFQATLTKLGTPRKRPAPAEKMTVLSYDGI